MIELAGSEGDLLFCFINEDQYGDGTREAAGRMLQIFGENYATAVSWALRRWAGDADAQPKIVENLSELVDLCEQFDGGCCGTSLFGPARFKGQRLRVKENTTESLPNLIEVRKSSFVVPDNVSPGSELTVNTFDSSYTIPIPADCWPGSTILLELKEGKLFMEVQK